MSLLPGKPLHWQGEQSGQRRGLQRLRGECNDWFVAGRTEGNLHRRPVMPLPLASQPEIHVCWGDRRLEPGVYRTDLWGGLGLVAQRQPEGAGAWCGHNWEYSWKKPGPR